MEVDEGVPVIAGDLNHQKKRARTEETGEREDDLQESDLEKPLPQDTTPFFLNLGVEKSNEGAIKETGDNLQGEPSKAVKPFTHRGETKKKKDDPMDSWKSSGGWR